MKKRQRWREVSTGLPGPRRPGKIEPEEIELNAPEILLEQQSCDRRYERSIRYDFSMPRPGATGATKSGNDSLWLYPAPAKAQCPEHPGVFRENILRGLLSNFPNDGWYWIWDEPSLSVYEKGVAQAIYRRQYRGNPVLLAREAIMQLASVSRSQVIRCESSLGSRGMLRMERTRHRHVFLYCVQRVQLDLFDRRKIYDSASPLVEKPVQNAVGNTGSAARPGDPGSGTVPIRDDEPPDRSYQEQIETENLINSKSKTRAEVRPRAANFADEEGKKRRIEAREDRVIREIEYLRNSSVGMGPGLEHIVAERIQEIAAKMDSLRPLSAAEYDRRRRAQLESLERRERS